MTFKVTDSNGGVGTATAMVAVTVDGPATMISPANASTLAGASQTFTWNPAAGANLYAVWVGTAPGAHDIGVFPVLGTTA
ncbi:MAG: hypothetical protein JZU65_11150, partial [Chlorobium sp.]|nr:hypothetical protein [Chlorobium sp.]